MKGPEVGYVDIIDEHFREQLAAQVAKGTDINKTPLRPSASGACTRELAFQLMEFHKLAKYEREPNSPEIDRVFKLGHVIESKLIRDIREALKLINMEVKYTQQSLSFAKLDAIKNPKLSQWLEGSTDLVLMSEDYKCIVDIKSKKDKFSSYRDNSWTEFDAKLKRMESVKKITDKAFWVESLPDFLNEVNDPFLAANFLQLNLYALNPFMIERGIDHGAIIQYNKNDSRIREIRFNPDQSLYDYVINKMQKALNAVDEGDPLLAEQEFELGSIKCAFCNYSSYCRPADDPLRSFFKTLPKKTWPTNTDRMGDEGLILEELYGEYVSVLHNTELLKNISNDIIAILLDKKVNKVKFADGEVYEVKLYKSPNEHFELKRSKI
jgi:CRISPR/Cas system-associated exonuclease Cas4 (RecB family)